jgi:hypothetical protein
MSNHGLDELLGCAGLPNALSMHVNHCIDDEQVLQHLSLIGVQGPDVPSLQLFDGFDVVVVRRHGVPRSTASSTPVTEAAVSDARWAIASET